MSKSKAKGTWAESTFAGWLAHHWPGAERRATNGAKDRGDIAGVPGVVFEVKYRKPYNISGALKEAEIERLNDNADYGIAIIKPDGVGETRVGEWWAVMTAESCASLLKDAGY